VAARCRIARLNVGVERDDARLETGATDGTAGTAMLGGGGDGILAALPMPLGSLTELLRPPALPGPRGIPLTPASCAKHGAGAARQPANAKAKKHDLPNIDPPPVSSASMAQRNGPSAGGYAEADLRVCRVFTQPTRQLNSQRWQSFPRKLALSQKIVARQHWFRKFSPRIAVMTSNEVPVAAFSIG
jgi:hypothetical protein